MTKHQKQAHSSSSKRASLQWRPLNEMFLSNGGKRKKAEKNQSWRPLDDILNDGKLLQQKLDNEAAAAQAVAHSSNSEDDVDVEISIQNSILLPPASPVPSEQSSITLDEEMIYSPLTDYHQHHSPIIPNNNHHSTTSTCMKSIDNWYPSLPFNHHQNLNNFNHQLSIETTPTNTTQHHHHPQQHNHHLFHNNHQHHHQWLPSLCKERPYYPPMTAEDTDTPIFMNYRPYDLL